MGRKHSSSIEAEQDLARAEQARARKRDNGLTFGSVKVALSWYWVMRERLQSPNASRPKTEVFGGKDIVMTRVDGGRRSSLEDVHATLITINKALQCLAQEPDGGQVRHDILVAAHRDGNAQEKIAQDRHISQSTVSRELYAAEAYLVGILRGDGGVLS